MEDKREKTRIICIQLAKKYKAEICNFDKTAIVVSGITDKQLTDLCCMLKCSGIYREEKKKGIITNFGGYK